MVRNVYLPEFKSQASDSVSWGITHYTMSKCDRKLASYSIELARQACEQLRSKYNHTSINTADMSEGTLDPASMT